MERAASITLVEGDETEVGSKWEEPTPTKQENVAYSLKSKQSLQARYIYSFIFFTTNLFAWFVRDYGHKLLTGLHRKSLISHYIKQ